MKKLLLKGKQLLSKKLQQLDIDSVQIDYVADQIPTRLKPLNLLRQNQIDLEDNHDYETYFKNYPNHHISHYLLDKIKSQSKSKNKNQESKLLGYIPPANQNSYIPQFDEALQQKALAFKAAVEEYDQGYNKIEQPLLCICVIHFHHKRGTEIQYKFPDDKKTDALSDQIIHHAMPDSSHLRDQDCNFFNFQSDCLGKKRMLFGVSYFKQIKVTQQMKKNNCQITRSHVQKAVAVISLVPLFQYIKIQLQNKTQIFFQNFTNFNIIQQAYIKINQNLLQTWPNIQLPDLYMGCQLKRIISCIGVSNLYDVWKALLYQKRVVVFAQTSSDASSFILSLLSLFPGLSAFGICSIPISRYLQSLRQYALPLRILNSYNLLSISFHVQDFWQLAKFSKNEEGNFLLGTTNRLLKESNEYGIQMLINLQDGTVVKNKSRRAWQPLAKKQRNFVSQLKQLVQNQDSNNLQDGIRIFFHQFLKNALMHMVVGIRDFQIFVNQCSKYQKLKRKLQKMQSFKDRSYKLMQDEEEQNVGQITQLGYAPTFPETTNQIILPQLLLNKSFAYFRQFHNSNLPEIINGRMIPSIYINDFEYYYRISQNEFISYNWLSKRLIFGKGVIDNFDGKQIKFRSNPNLQIYRQMGKEITRSIFIGFIMNGKYFKHGFYVDKSEYYQGQFYNGLKHGYGKFNKGSEKYIGNFYSNLYDGEGQLVKNGEVYSGSFKQGQKHGFGSLQGNQSYSGQWRQDKPIRQNDSQNWTQKLKDNQKRRNSGEARKN